MNLNDFGFFEKAIKESALTNEELNLVMSHILILKTHYESISVIKESIVQIILEVFTNMHVENNKGQDIADEILILQEMILEEIEEVYEQEQYIFSFKKLPVELKVLIRNFSISTQLRLRGLYEDTLMIYL